MQRYNNPPISPNINSIFNSIYGVILWFFALFDKLTQTIKNIVISLENNLLVLYLNY